MEHDPQILNPVEQDFTSWLHRAYLDLGPVPERAPHHLWGLELGIRAVMERRPYPRIQSALNPSFRQALIRQTGKIRYAIETPHDLSPELRTERWQALCDACDRFHEQPPADKVRIAWLLGKICLQRYLLRLLGPEVYEHIGDSPEAASLAYLRAYARFRMSIDDPLSPYDISEFERIANEAPPGIAYIDAHYQMVSQYVKTFGDVKEVEHWHPRQLAAIERSRAELDEFNYLLVMSRYHRVGGFIPQLHRDKRGVVEEMDLAEKYARALPRADAVLAIAADEMLYPVLESRTKEAIWIGDLELALERARATTELSPYDARAWLHLGQVHLDRDEVEQALRAYSMSARFSPPGREVALFMVGQCYEELEDVESAIDAYLGSLWSDPLGISSAERLAELAAQTGNTMIGAWVQSRLQALEGQAVDAPAPRAEPYKHLPSPVEHA